MDLFGNLMGSDDDSREQDELSPKEIDKGINKEIEQIKYLLQRWDSHIKPTTVSNNVVIIGNTGSGKSTLLNYMGGIDLIATKTQTSKLSRSKLMIDVSNSNNIEGVAKIGNTYLSETSLPNIIPCNDKNIIFCDCPGFGDNKGHIQEIANAYYIKKILNLTPDVKIIIAVEVESFGQKASKFFDVITSISQVFGNSVEIFNNMLLIITKIGEDISLDDMPSELNKIIKECSNHITEYQHNILDHFVKHPNQITFFHAPLTEGPINKNDRVQIEEKLRLIPPIKSPDINISISANTKDIISNLMNLTRDKIVKLFCELCTQICLNITEECEVLTNQKSKYKTTKLLIDTFQISIDKINKYKSIFSEIISNQCNDILGSMNSLTMDYDLLTQLNMEIFHYNFFRKYTMNSSNIDYKSYCISEAQRSSTTFQTQSTNLLKTLHDEINFRIHSRIAEFKDNINKYIISNNQQKMQLIEIISKYLNINSETILLLDKDISNININITLQELYGMLEQKKNLINSTVKIHDLHPENGFYVIIRNFFQELILNVIKDQSIFVRIKYRMTIWIHLLYSTFS